VKKKEERKSPTPTPPQGGVREKRISPGSQSVAVDAVAFSRFRQTLKTQLCDAMPLGKQQHMPTLVDGVEGFDGCFRDWWWVSFKRRGPGELPLLETESPDSELTSRTVEKYRKRIENLMPHYFGGPVEIQVITTQHVE
jgi:hypothetical protein